jgi:hypothetical protein
MGSMGNLLKEKSRNGWQKGKGVKNGVGPEEANPIVIVVLSGAACQQNTETTSSSFPLYCEGCCRPTLHL